MTINPGDSQPVWEKWISQGIDLAVDVGRNVWGVPDANAATAGGRTERAPVGEPTASTYKGPVFSRPGVTPLLIGGAVLVGLAVLLKD